MKKYKEIIIIIIIISIFCMYHEYIIKSLENLPNYVYEMIYNNYVEFCTWTKEEEKGELIRLIGSEKWKDYKEIVIKWNNNMDEKYKDLIVIIKEENWEIIKEKILKEKIQYWIEIDEKYKIYIKELKEELEGYINEKIIRYEEITRYENEEGIRVKLELFLINHHITNYIWSEILKQKGDILLELMIWKEEGDYIASLMNIWCEEWDISKLFTEEKKTFLSWDKDIYIKIKEEELLIYVERDKLLNEIEIYKLSKTTMVENIIMNKARIEDLKLAEKYKEIIKIIGEKEWENCKLYIKGIKVFKEERAKKKMRKEIIMTIFITAITKVIKIETQWTIQEWIRWFMRLIR